MKSALQPHLYYCMYIPTLLYKQAKLKQAVRCPTKLCHAPLPRLNTLGAGLGWAGLGWAPRCINQWDRVQCRALKQCFPTGLGWCVLEYLAGLHILIMLCGRGRLGTYVRTVPGYRLRGSLLPQDLCLDAYELMGWVSYLHTLPPFHGMSWRRIVIIYFVVVGLFLF